MRRTLLCAALALTLAGPGCGGRTGLGVFTDASVAPPADAAAADAPPGDAAPLYDGAPPADLGVDAAHGRDAAAGKNCAEVMSCVFSALGSGGGWQGLLECRQGASSSGLSQSIAITTCLAQHCYQYFITDAGGQFEILACLIQNCQPQVCACDGIDQLIPPGILNCP